MAEEKRKYRDLLSETELPDDALALAIELATSELNATAFARDEKKKELNTDRKKGQYFLRSVVVGPALRTWVEETKANKSEDEKAARIEELRSRRLELDEEIKKGESELATLTDIEQAGKKQ